MKKFLLFSFVFLSFYSVAQNSTTPLWTDSYASAGDNTDRYYSVAPLSGGFVAVGYSVKQGNYRDFLTVRTDASGNVLWSKSKNGAGSGNDVAQFVVTDASNNVYVAGYTDGGNSQDDIYLLKYDINGNLLWDTTWNNPVAFQDDVPTDMAIDASGNIFICGITEPDPLPGSSDYVVLKFSPSGGLLWHATYSRAGVAGGRDDANALALDPAGDVYVTGRSFNGADDDIVTLKYSGANGSLAWTPAIYNSSSGDDRGADIAINPAGNAVVVTGRTDNGNDDDVRTIKYNTSGIFQWTRFYNSSISQNDRGLFVHIDAQDNIYVGGQSDVDFSALTNYDYLVLKYNSLGTITWSRTDGFPALQADIPTSMVVDNSGNIALTGYSDFDSGLTTVLNYIYTVVWNNAGTRLSFSYATGTSPTGNSEGGKIIVDPVTGNYIVAGFVENIGTRRDGALVSSTGAGTNNWTRSHNFNGDFTSAFRSVVANGSAQAIAVGNAYMDGNERDAFIRVVSNSGQFLCNYFFNGTNDEDDELVDAAIDASGMVYAVGYTKTAGQKSNYLLMKFNPAVCDTVWTRQYNYVFNQSDRAVAVALDASGNVYVTGRSDQDLNDTIDNNDVVTLKYSPAGALLWTQRFNGASNGRDEPSDLAIDASGNVLVCGRTQAGLYDDAFVIKYDGTTGVPVWSGPAVYSGSAGLDDRAYAMDLDANGNAFVAGKTVTVASGGSEDILVFRVTAAGAVTGNFTYNGSGSGNDEAEAIAVDYQNNVVVLARADSDPSTLVSNYDYLTVKLDNALQNQLWNAPKVYDGPLHDDEQPIAISINSVGEILVTGYSAVDTVGGTTDNNIVSIRYDAWGNQDWLASWQGPSNGDDEPFGLLQENTATWICGISDNPTTLQSDALLLRYELATSVSVPDGYDELLIAFPNPASERVRVRYSGNITGSERIVLYDAVGRAVFERPLVFNESDLDLKGVASGKYLLTVTGPDVASSAVLIVH
ncbi:MAG: hypothetical protein RL213_2182 [Bacteroidota bacterium]|jgi:uncharacterized delta-60 repeat protein